MRASLHCVNDVGKVNTVIEIMLMANNGINSNMIVMRFQVKRFEINE